MKLTAKILMFEQFNESKKIKTDFFTGSEFEDDKGKKFKVEEVYDFVKNNYEVVNLDIDEVRHQLEWWHRLYSISIKEHRERMMRADTSVPILVIEEEGNLNVADGLNRLYKAINIENKDKIPAYVVRKEDIEHLGSLANSVEFDRLAFYLQYYKNLSPSEFKLSKTDNSITIQIPSIGDKTLGLKDLYSRVCKLV
jgi:hypothetical protein